MTASLQDPACRFCSNQAAAVILLFACVSCFYRTCRPLFFNSRAAYPSDRKRATALQTSCCSRAVPYTLPLYFHTIRFSSLQDLFGISRWTVFLLPVLLMSTNRRGAVNTAPLLFDFVAGANTPPFAWLNTCFSAISHPLAQSDSFNGGSTHSPKCFIWKPFLLYSS